MKTVEYGNNKKDIIILLHGGGLSWWNYREVAGKLKDRYHVIIPVLDGHAGSDRSFTTIEDNADEIIRYIEENFGGSVLLMGGLSLGGQILLEILSRRSDICRYAIIESAMVIPSKITHALIKPAFGTSYGLIKYRWFSRLQFKSLHMKKELFEDYYRDTCAINKEDMISFLRANTGYTLKESIKDCRAKIYIYIGGKENKGIKDSAVRIQKSVPKADITVLPGLYHGEISINRPNEYVQKIDDILRRHAK